MKALSWICPSALLACGTCYLTWGLSSRQPSQLGDLGLCLLGEWLPSVTSLAVLNPLQCGAPLPTDSLDDSTDSEAPLLQDQRPPSASSRALPGNSMWKQIYPQVSAK